MAFRVLLAGGGTGGHVVPLVAVANALRSRARQDNFDLELLVVGEGSLLKDICQQNNLKCRGIIAGKIRRYFSFLNFLDVFKFPISFLQSLWYLFWFMPDAVFAKGGYASFFPALVAKLYFIPLIIHESDSVSGLTNKIIGKIANRVLLAFKSAEVNFNPAKVQVVGNPFLPDILSGNREEALNYFKFNPDKKTILVLGGSQGARGINNAILASIVEITREFQVIHQCGDSLFAEVSAERDKIIQEGEGEYAQAVLENYKIYPFLDTNQLAQAYALADVVIARAGAATIFGTAAVGKPTIVVPLANSAGNHQFLNAQEFSRFGAVLIEEQNLTTHLLLNQISNLLKPENYTAISEKIKSFAKNDAADLVAGQILAYKK